jgi:hypothetical protein
MAIVKSGPYVGFSGTIDGITFYQLPDGRTVSKKQNKKSTTPPTAEQELTQSDMGMISRFIKPFEEIAKVGYQHLKTKGGNTHNALASHIWAAALDKASDGSHFINLSKLLITQGDLPAAKDLSVELTESGLEFSWNPEVESHLCHHSDQAIMLAYFPELEEVECKIGGAERKEGKDLLVLSGIEKGHTAEIYIAFATNDRSVLSNSIYLGSLNW